MKEKLYNLYQDSLFRNSFFLILTSGLMAGFGFFFWLICARVFDAKNVGLATSLISAASLMSIFSTLGFNNVIIRFLPTSQRKDHQISTALISTGILSIIVSALFCIWAIFTHNSAFTATNVLWLLIMTFSLQVFSTTLNTIFESVFIAYRRAGYILTKSIIFSTLKLIILFTVIDYGFYGILGATAISTTIACLLSIIWLIKKFSYHPVLTIDSETVEETKHFAAGNYLGTLFGILPSTTLILIISSRLGPEFAAFFYIPSMFITLLNVIPSSSAQSFFAEVSHDEPGMHTYFKQTIKHLFGLLVPASALIILAGGYILSFFGANYAQAGTNPLRIMVLASFVGAANYLGDTLLNIKKMSRTYIFMNALNSLAIVIPAYIVAPYGLVTIAWISLLGQIITLGIYLIINRNLLISLRTNS
ncbi:MAG TPA: oligosaccharide flippase family protein [Candidatus Paceibacterota bacterium]|nr:oligosaccharide flippase family protein [Candidatus Paceibacterota bacterium]